MADTIKRIKPAFTLGALITNPKVLGSKIDEMIVTINDILDGTTNLTIVEVSNGTAAAPSMSFTSDSDTGIYRIGANNIGVTTGGTKRLDVSSTGLSVTGAISASTSIAATTTLASTTSTSVGTSLAVGTVIGNGDGAVGAPSYSFTSDTDTGVYRVGANQLGFAANGVLQGFFGTSGLAVGNITEQVTGSGITLGKNIVRQNTLTALNSTGTVTAAIILKGGITSTSASPVTATLDTAANIGTAIGATNGTSIEFLVDNTAGANTVTVAIAAGITAATPVITGGGTLTVSTANAIGIFRLVFSDASTAKLYRIG